ADANKSEVEKANDRASKAEAELAQLPAKVAAELRTHLIEMHGIDKDKADLFLTGSDPDLLLRQAQALVGNESDRKKANNYVPTEGAQKTTGTASTADAFAEAVESLLD